jgi:hypothetical protein
MLFGFTIIHVPGVENIVADALSRVFAMMTLLILDVDSEDDREQREDQLEIRQQETPDKTWDQNSLQEYFNRFHNGVTWHLTLANTIKSISDAGCENPI